MMFSNNFQSCKGTLWAGLLCLLMLAPLQAQVKPRVLESGVPNPGSALYVGNSFFYYNNSLHGHVTLLNRSAEGSRALRSVSVTISGSGFDWHDMESYFRPKALSSYSFDPNNKIVFNKLDRLFDVAIMMDCSQCPIHPDLKSVFTDFAKKSSEIVRRHGTKPVFFMSWAYADAPQMTQQLSDAYTQAANDNDAFVIPAGLAFARSLSLRPDLGLTIADKRHPTLMGTYLAACTTYAALFKKSPVGLSYLAGLDAAVARHLQTVAGETVQDYHRP